MYTCGSSPGVFEVDIGWCGLHTYSFGRQSVVFGLSWYGQRVESIAVEILLHPTWKVNA